MMQIIALIFNAALSAVGIITVGVKTLSPATITILLIVAAIKAIKENGGMKR